MIGTFIFPAKKNLDNLGKVLAIILVLTVSIFESTTTAAANALILDNSEAGTSSTGKWKPWSARKKSNPYGKNSLYTYSRDATYTYNLDLPSAGEYQVFAWWTTSRIHSTSVPYDITHVGGTSTVTVNQQKNGGQWNQLGATWNFDTTAAITIRLQGVGTVIADAIMLVPVGSNTNTAPVTTAPVISGTPAGSATANESYSFQPSASDADGDQLTFSISNKPEWASFSTSNGRLSGTPSENHVKTYSSIVISVTDGTDTVSLPAFSIQVAAAPVENTAPVISGSPAGSATANESYSFQPSASDADGDQLTFSISNKPEWASFSTSNGRLSGTPSENHVKTYSSIVISVTDGSDTVSLPAFSIQVAAAPVENTAPVISGSPAGSATANESYSFQPSASDADGDQLTFSISNKPEWASFSTSNGRLSGTPSENHVKTYSSIVISVTDGSDTVSLPAFSIQVAAAPVENTAPVISGSPAGSATANESYSFQPSASDADGDQLTFSISNKPEWANFSTSSGRLSGTPADSHVKTYSGIAISVTDGTDAVSLPSFSITVAAEEESARVTANLVSFYPFTERSGNVVRDLSGSASPMDLTISGNVSWYGAGNGVVMNGGRVGTQGPATDLINALRASNTSTFEIWIQPANITQFGPARWISVGGDTSKQNFMLGQDRDDVEARLLHTGKQSMLDPKLLTDNGVLDTSLVHLVHTYDGAVERLYINGVQHSQTVNKSGGYGNWDMSDLFSIGNEASSDRPYNGIIRLVAVYDRPLGTAEIQQNYGAGPVATGVSGGTGGANYVPVILGTPAGSVATDQGYDFMPTASDANGDTLVFSIVGKPVWANFDTTTGRLSGTPTLIDAGTYSNIVISVTDGSDTVSLPAFSIQVAAAPVENTAPVISGSPAGSATANESYSFQPSASDADGDQLTFSISNKPEWASFSTSNGRLSGTPSENHVKTYSSIVISVTDGSDIASLGTFSIAVNGTATQTGSVTLNWTAPVARTDGTPIMMSEIAGFTVYYGASTGDYPNRLSVDDGSATSATIADLLAGTYYLAVTTRDYEGRESSYSEEVAKVVNY